MDLDSRDGRLLYLAARHRDARAGVWEMPARGGTAHLIVAFDNPALAATGNISVGPDRLYLTVAEYESDVWMANVHY